MDRVMSETKKLFSATNVVGYILGLMGLSLFAITQFISALLPLLFAPMVCGTFGLLLYTFQPSNPQSKQIGWDLGADGKLTPNWNEQDRIDWMKWQVEVNGMSAAAVADNLNSRGIQSTRGGVWQVQSVNRAIALAVHSNRQYFPYPTNWGTMPWHQL